MVVTAKGARITGEEREQLMLSCVRRYRAGESIRSLAADIGRSYGFVQGLLKEAGVPLRTRGGATRGAEAEADRAERQARVEAVRAAEAADPTDLGIGADTAPVLTGAKEPPGPRNARTPPTSPADLGLPTPPLSVLVRTRDKGKSKAKKVAAEKAKQHSGQLPVDGGSRAKKDKDAKKSKKSKKGKKSKK